MIRLMLRRLTKITRDGQKKQLNTDLQTLSYALRLESDVLIQADVHVSPVAVGKLAPPMNEAKCYKNVRLWADGIHCSHLVLATVAVMGGTCGRWLSSSIAFFCLPARPRMRSQRVDSVFSSWWMTMSPVR